MSESVINVVYFSVACISFVITVSKARATWRDFSPSLMLITSAAFWGAVAFVVMSPVVYRTLGTVSGRPALPTLLAYLCIFAFATHQHILVVLWGHQSGAAAPRAQPRDIPAISALYAALAVAMVALFLAVHTGPADPMTFDITYVTDPTVFCFLLVYCVSVSFALWNAVRRCATYANSMNHVETRRGLRLIRIGSAITLLSFIEKALGFTAVAVGHPALGVLDTSSPLLGTIGAYCIQAGYLGPALAVWFRERRDFRRLRPLWELVVPGNALQLSRPGLLTEILVLDTRFHLRRRIVEITDALHVLRPWMTPAPAQRARRAMADRGVSAEELDALAVAATVLDALARKKRGESGKVPQDLLPRVAPSQQRPHLVRVAQALLLPAVRDALGRVSQIPPGPRRLARSLAALSGPPEYAPLRGRPSAVRSQATPDAAG